ncbi:hypothetical protein WMY93_001216 [Mugilogobius chulae]|uniref:Uncharacterized protein n=1 Tax=Mugilogobius chulae TaxID=88201 RepID=A0AAW0Q2L2_9GOBI
MPKCLCPPVDPCVQQGRSCGLCSLCPRELLLPKERCPHPRLVKVPGQCCEQLICPDETKTIKKYRRKQRLFEDFVNGEKDIAAMWSDSSIGFRTYALENTAMLTVPPDIRLVLLLKILWHWSFLQSNN